MFFVTINSSWEEVSLLLCLCWWALKPCACHFILWCFYYFHIKHLFYSPTLKFIFLLTGNLNICLRSLNIAFCCEKSNSLSNVCLSAPSALSYPSRTIDSLIRPTFLWMYNTNTYKPPSSSIILTSTSKLK